MPKVVAGLMALIALAASVVGQIDVTTALIRAAIAYTAGLILTSLWYTAFGSKEPSTASQVGAKDGDENSPDKAAA